MAVTGGILVGFTLVHMAGNLQIYLGADVLNHYGQLLKSNVAVLWGARLFLLASVCLHLTAAFQLWSLKAKARPVAYQKLAPTKSSYASRTMYVSGPILLFFIIYHLSHLTTGQTHPQFDEGDVYRNVVLGFRQPVAFAAYLIAMGCLGFHLIHGVWSAFQSLGINHPKYTPKIRNLATGLTALIVGGNLSIPVAVMLRLIGNDVQ
ncbi:MAG: succinate dehydrogenase cytochrome b subunit [Bryobacteraceae bacterium]|nr:succinate dehydrogenase cytochrome b subunit [Bryobacteraceae bacterium]